MSQRWWAAARLAVLALPVGLALVQIGRLQVLGTDRHLLVGVAALALCLPPHLWHLWWGLRGQRPRGAHWSLAAMAVVNVVALVLAGPILIYLIALLATSAVVVLPVRWAALTLATCAAAAVAALALPAAASLQETTFGAGWYVAYTVVFQTVLLSSLVWLVAAAHQLQVTRSALVAARAERERTGLASGVATTLSAGLDEILERASAARRTTTPLAVQSVVDSAATTLDRLRVTVADARASGPSTWSGEEQAALGPVADYFVSRRARSIAVMLYAVVLAFPLVKTLIELESASWLWWAGATVMWALAAVPTALIAWRHAQGRPSWVPAFRPVAVGALLLVVSVWLVGVAIGGDVWNQVGWFAGATAVLLLPWRWGAAVTLLIIGGMIAVDLQGLASSSAWTLLVWGTYVVALAVEAVAALVASSTLVRLVDQLTETRRRLADHAADEQRWQLTSEVHDVLGQTLTAICLKGDLARRLLDVDQARARVELDELAQLAHQQVDQAAAVLDGQVADAETSTPRHTIRRLREAGITVTVGGPLSTCVEDPDLPEVFTWVLREAATNVLRHSDARRVTIATDRSPGIDRLHVSNDGVHYDGTEVPPMGNGLRGLARRVESEGGQLTVQVVEPDGYQLTVSLPASSAVAAGA